MGAAAAAITASMVEVGLSEAVAAAIVSGVGDAALGAGLGATMGGITGGDPGMGALGGAFTGGAIGGLGGAAGDMLGGAGGALGSAAPVFGDVLAGAGGGMLGGLATGQNVGMGALQGAGSGLLAGLLGGGLPGSGEAPTPGAGNAIASTGGDLPLPAGGSASTIGAPGAGATMPGAAAIAAPASTDIASGISSLGPNQTASLGSIDMSGAGNANLVGSASAPSAPLGQGSDWYNTAMSDPTGVMAAGQSGAVNPNLATGGPGSVQMEPLAAPAGMSPDGSGSFPAPGTAQTAARDAYLRDVGSTSSAMPGAAAGGAGKVAQPGFLDKIGATLTGGEPTDTLSQGVGKALGVLPSAGMMGAQLIGGQQQPKGYNDLSSIAGQQLQQSQQLMQMFQSGTLPAGLKQSLDSASESAKAAIRSRYASMGQSGSSAEAQDLAGVDARVAGQGGQMLLQLLQAGMSEQNAASGLYRELLGANVAQDSALSNAMTGFASSLAGGGGGIKLNFG